MQTFTQDDRVMPVSAAPAEPSAADPSTLLQLSEEDQLFTCPQNDTSATRSSCVLDNGPRRRARTVWQLSTGGQFLDFLLETHRGWHMSFRWCKPNIEAEMQMRLHNCFGAVGLDSPDLCVRARMISHHGYSQDKTRLELSGLLLAALPLVYGGAHAAQWNSHFPTKIERKLWRMCAIIATCYVPIGFFLAVVQDWCVGASVVEELLVVSAGFMILVGMPLFFCARLFLTVESFLSLRSLPLGSFQTVSWSNYWPHF